MQLPIKDSKTVPPSTCVTVHGIELDTVNMEARLPMEKLTKARVLLGKFIESRRITLRDLQAMLGFLNFAGKVISPGRPFLRRLINLTKGITHPFHHIHITPESRSDAKAWLLFLQSFNGISVFPESHISDSESLRLYSDASGALGFAGIFGAKWLAGHWPPHLAEAHITAKEMFPITLIAEIWGYYLQNKRVLFHTDNASVACAINKQSCRDPRTMSLLRRLVVASLTHNIIFRAKYIKGSTNVLADYLSRFQFQDALNMAPWLDRRPTPVPPNLMSPTYPS